MMEKEFIPYEQALALKELGFDEPCFAWYVSESYGLEYGEVIKSDLIRDGIVAPTYSQAFKFFREKHNLHINKTGNSNYTSFNMVEPKIEVISFVRYTDTENHYEEAELECLKKLIEIVKEN
jgi:AICAR transformylase/IMP cyclohydrolase PurH